jgi:HNH endonuclease
VPEPSGPPAGVVVEDRGYKTPCWISQGKLDRHGYKQVHVGGRKRAPTYAHRIGYEETHGPIPAGLTVDHLCRVRSCRRGSHLEAVTRAENVRRGERVKITRADAEEIRRRRREGGRPVDLAAEYGLSRGSITNIVKGRTWPT